MQRTRLGIITTSEHESYFESAFEACETLFNTEWLIDPYTDITTVLNDWKSARVDAVIVDEEALVFSCESLSELQRWLHGPMRSTLPIVFIGLDDRLRDTPPYQSIDGVALGGILYPNREPSVRQALVDRLDALPLAASPASRRSESRVGCLLEESIHHQEEGHPAKEETRDMFINRKKHAQDFEKEIYESLGGKSEASKETAAESFFAATPTPSYPENDPLGDPDAHIESPHTPAERQVVAFRFDEMSSAAGPPVFDADGAVTNPREEADGAPSKPDRTWHSFQKAADSERDLEMRDSTWHRPSIEPPQDPRASDRTAAPSSEQTTPIGNRMKDPEPNAEEILEKLDMLLDQFKLLDNVEKANANANANEGASAARAEPSFQEPKKTPRPASVASTPKSSELGHPEGACLVSVAGLQSNCGQVHLGIATGLWLANLGYKTCFVFSDRMQFASMRSAMDVRDLTNGSFRFDQCDFYCWNKSASYYDSYDYVVIDCGALVFSNHSKSFMKGKFCEADVSMMCASGAPWNIYLVAETLKTIQAKELVCWRWFFQDAPQGFIREIKPAFDQLKKRVSRTTDFGHLYLLSDTSSVDPSSKAPLFERALYSVLPASMRTKIRKQNQENDFERK